MKQNINQNIKQNTKENIKQGINQNSVPNKKKLYVRDIILIACVVLFAGLWYAGIHLFGQTGNCAVVYVDEQVVKTLPLHTDCDYKVKSKQGYNIVRIKDGKVSIVHSDCPKQLCVHQKAISKTGESIVCLPHKVVVTIEGKGANDIDGITH